MEPSKIHVASHPKNFPLIGNNPVAKTILFAASLTKKIQLGTFQTPKGASGPAVIRAREKRKR